LANKLLFCISFITFLFNINWQESKVSNKEEEENSERTGVRKREGEREKWETDRKRREFSQPENMMWQIAILSGHRYLILFPVASLRGMDAGLSVSVYMCELVCVCVCVCVCIVFIYRRLHPSPVTAHMHTLNPFSSGGIRPKSAVTWQYGTFTA